MGDVQAHDAGTFASASAPALKGPTFDCVELQLATFFQDYREMARNGVEVNFECPGLTTHEKQSNIANPKVREMAKDKILKMVKQEYLVTTGFKVKLLIKYFAVPKENNDIRLVYDATVNCLNKCMWVPTFLLPTINILVRVLCKDSWMMGTCFSTILSTHCDPVH